MAVKTTRWTGGTSTDWDTASNWSNGVPSTTEKDSIYVAREATGDLLLNVDRRTDAVGGVNYGADFTVFEIEEGCTVNVGTSSEPARFTADNVYVRGGGHFYYYSQKGSLGTNSTENLVVDAAGGAATMYYINGPDTSDFLAGVSTITGTSTGPYAIRMGQSLLSSPASARLTLSGIGTSSNIYPIHVSTGAIVLDNTSIDNSASFFVNYGGSVTVKNGAYIYEYVQCGGHCVAESATQSRFFRDAKLMGGVIDTRSYQSSYGSPASGTMTIFPGAQWLRTAAQEAATTVDYIGE